MDNKEPHRLGQRGQGGLCSAPRSVSPSSFTTSPQAVEAALASISEEVTADAIERRRDKGKPC